MLLADKTGSLDLGGCPKWVTGNAGGSGYYRTALDEDATGKLTESVAQLTVPERMIFFSDVDAAAHAGATEAARAFQLVLALAGDKDRHVVEQLLPPLRYLRRRAILSDDALAKYGAFVRDGFSRRTHALGLAEKKGESDDIRILRLALLRIVGDEGGDLQLRADAQKLALKWIGDRKAVQPELASTALYLTALDADEPLWDRLHEVIKAEKDRVDRQRLIDAIDGLPDGIGELKGQAMAIKRFDRSDKGPVHIEDFAQVFGVYPEGKYDHATYRRIAGVLGIETGDADIAEFIRRLVFSTLIGNADMHLKNWSLIYKDGRTPTLSPAYDLLSTIPYIADETMALKYSRTKKMAEFSKDELKHLAAKARISEKLVLDTAAETVARFKQVWSEQKTKLPLEKKVVEMVDAHAASIPIYKEL